MIPEEEDIPSSGTCAYVISYGKRDLGAVIRDLGSTAGLMWTEGERDREEKEGRVRDETLGSKWALLALKMDGG